MMHFDTCVILVILEYRKRRRYVQRKEAFPGGDFDNRNWMSGRAANRFSVINQMAPAHVWVPPQWAWMRQLSRRFTEIFNPLQNLTKIAYLVPLGQNFPRLRRA